MRASTSCHISIYLTDLGLPRREAFQRENCEKHNRSIHMDILISAVASELVSRFISFLSRKYRSQACLEDNIELLQHLLLRVHTVVEEAEGRYIQNSRMLIQLKKLQEAMYQGYDALDTYVPLKKVEEVLVSGSYMWLFLTATSKQNLWQ